MTDNRLNPQYTDKPEDLVNDSFHELITAWGRAYMEWNDLKQIYPETSERLKTTFYGLTLLVSDDAVTLPRGDKDTLDYIKSFMINMRSKGFYTVGLKKASLMRLFKEK